jgi:hypothetical protein
MPESNHNFRPDPAMRSFGELMSHVADAQSGICRSMLSDKKPIPNVTGTSKADVQKALAASFDECYEAFSELSAENQNQPVSTPEGERARVVALTMVLGHDNEEYGYMAVYLRLKGHSAALFNQDQGIQRQAVAGLPSLAPKPMRQQISEPGKFFPVLEVLVRP